MTSHAPVATEFASGYRQPGSLADKRFRSQPGWPLRAATGLTALAAIVIFEVRSFDTHLWTDEILTITLSQASSLPKLWTGIASGIDANPPLYLTLAWFVAHLTPSPSSIFIVLRTANLLLVMGAALILFRLSRRGASLLAAWTGGFLFVALNTNLPVIATELRTYAIYFFLAVLAVFLQQRLVERGRPQNAVALALCYMALTLSHTFGIVYVACIALSGCVSVWNQGWTRIRLTALAAIPALITFGCWIPFLIQQSAVGKPYLWITAPDFAQLLLIMWSAPTATWIAVIELFCLTGAAIGSMREHGTASLMAFRDDPRSQYPRYVVAVTASISAFTIALWGFSLFVFPIFVPRYFVPQIMVSFALHVAFCELIVRAVAQRSKSGVARLTRYAMVVLPLLFSFVLLQRHAGGQDRCANASGGFFEAGFVRGDIPVVADSPHLFLPRAYYAEHHSQYRFPLDWEVVLNYPQRDPGNATDYNIFERLGLWLPMPSIVQTEELIKTSPEFLVIESDRAWFENLRKTRNVAAEKLTEVVTPRGETCTLWKVSSVKAKL